MQNDANTEYWSTANFALIEASLWLKDQNVPTNLAWLEASWQYPAQFWKALHNHWERQQAGQSKSIPLSRYDFYHDLIVRQKEQTTSALVWFESGNWQTLSYTDLQKTVDRLAASWEEVGVQPRDILVILHSQWMHCLTAFLAGLRLGMVISLLPPQGDAFVRRRLENLTPQWLAMDSLYRHRLEATWQEKILPNTLSSMPPTRRSYEYLSTDIVVQCFDSTSLTPDAVCPVDADTLYLGALRDSVLSLGLKAKQLCAAPDWYSLECQPSLILAVLLSGATWVHINLADIAKEPARLLEQPIDVLGVSQSLRDLLLLNPPVGDKTWRYWFRHPAESPEFTVWQDFIERLQLKESYSGNVLWNSAYGGAVIFSTRCQGQTHRSVLPAAGIHWQLGMIVSPELPCLEGSSGRMALGKEEKDDMVWTATPHILTPHLTAWHYLGCYPHSRAGRTYPRQEVLELLANNAQYLALVEAPAGTDGDLRQVLLVFGENVNVTALQQCIETELGHEFQPDRIEVLPLLPKRDEKGGVDQEWCQFHYVTGELYRRQRNAIYRCLSELKQKILA